MSFLFTCILSYEVTIYFDETCVVLGDMHQVLWGRGTASVKQVLGSGAKMVLDGCTMGARGVQGRSKMGASGVYIRGKMGAH